MNNKLLMLIALLGIGAGVRGEKPEDIRKFPQAEPASKIIYSNSFEDKNAPGMEFKTGGVIAPGEGTNGTSALKISSLEPVAKGLYTTLNLPEIPVGAKLKVKFAVRSENIQMNGQAPSKAFFPYASTEYKNLKTGKSQGFANWTRVAPGKEYGEMEYSFTALEGYKPFLVFRLSQGWSGTLWFDDVQVFTEGSKKLVFLNYPRQRTFMGNTEYSLNVYAPELKKPCLLVSMVMGDKVIQEQVVLPNADNEFAGKFNAPLPEGAGEIRAVLADLESKKQFETFTFPVTVSPESKPPAGAASVDRYGRMIVDGKPFLPIGMGFHLSGGTPEDFRKVCSDLSNAGFNMTHSTDFLLGYKNPKFFTYFTGDQAVDTVKILDVLNEYGLKCHMPVGVFYDHYRWQPKSFMGVNGMEAMTRKTVETLRRHPALLIWYISDEIAWEHRDKVLEMRRIANSLDPWHPTLSVHYAATLLPDCSIYSDIAGVDNYPITRETKETDISTITSMMKQAVKGGVPQWGVIQAFNWAYYLHEVKSSERYRSYSTPSEEAIRAMTFLYALGGAKGFWFFTYPKTKMHWDKMKIFEDATYDEVIWERVKKVVPALKKMEPYIMGKEEIVPLTVVNKMNSTVSGGIFTADNGEKAVVIVAAQGCGAEAEFTLPGMPGLKSLYGKIEDLGNGNYRFKTDRLDADILTREF